MPERSSEGSYSTLGTVFRGNSILGDLLELYLFTNVKSLTQFAFQNTTMGKLIIPPHISSFSSSSLPLARASLVDFPSTITSIPNYTSGASVWIIRAINPPSITTYSSLGGTIYVPDESVNAYKTNSSWSRFASRIHPLSEYTG